MKAPLFAILLLLTGCEALQQSNDSAKLAPHLDPNRVDWWDRSIPHRDGFRAYHVAVEITSPGSRIEVNGEHVATIAGTTGEVVLWADANGTFRNNQLVSIVANPTKVGEFRQTKVFAGAL